MTIYGQVPSKANSYKIITINGHGSLAKSQRLKEYERDFFMQCPCRGLCIKEPFTLSVKVFYGSNRPDLDNSLKIILDCLQTAGVIENDRWCVKIIAEKVIDKVNPRCELVINH